MNLYAYVHNDPMNFTDPTGNSSEIVNPFENRMREEVVVTGSRQGSDCGCATLTGAAARAFVAAASAANDIAMSGGVMGWAVSGLFNSNADGSGQGTESTPDTDKDNWDKIPGSKGAYRPKGKKEPVFEQDRAGGRGHGGSKWKKWNKSRDWEKGKRRDGTYDESGKRLRD